MHAGQLTVSVDTVRQLVDRQFPQWRDLPITPVASQGTVNGIFRVGSELTGRFPLEPGDPPAVRRRLESEAAAARELFGRTRCHTPEPVALGEPGAGYPLPWSVYTWLPGTVATDTSQNRSAPFARDLAGFVREVRAIDRRGRTFSGQGRGGDLKAHDTWMGTCFERSGHLLDVSRLRALWDRLRELPRGPTRDVMTHGDLIPGNLLARDGRLTGVIDVGGLGPADPSLDMVGAWHLFEPGCRAEFRTALGCTDLEWARGKAWAFEQAMGAAWYYARSNPAMSDMGHRTLQRILADEPA